MSTFIWTLGEILHATNSGVYIADHTPASHRGRFNSLMSIVQGLGHGISPLIMGRFIQKYGVRNVWPLIFILSSAASIFMYLLSKYDKKKI
ncbi:MFS transporter [Caloramator sp. Dgby_cultured_2]|uniref:MFS transporter n=1 Tax=Caloramator sp. Dgby_cultured_2 TaxID=3029174 RepID=UPI00237DD625|nr:MFS transporter [Caloramator sp. Dgby_cultured_2]WDU83257.1 MFS transporter [Caloramator sp. Dgby_cultured_2]